MEPTDPIETPAAIRRRLAALIEAAEARTGGGRTSAAAGEDDVAVEVTDETADVVPTGWDEVDRFLGRAGRRGGGKGGLVRRAVHEWLGLEPVDRREAGWTAPRAVLIHLAARGLACGRGGWAAWIGQPVWPCPLALLPVHGHDGGDVLHDDVDPVDPLRSGALWRRSLFIDPPDGALRLWAIDLALRCPALDVVVADGRGLTMAQSRRLQLAAARGAALGLLVRPASERARPSAAMTRWTVAHAVPPPDAVTARPRWTITVWRCKGRQASDEQRMPTSWCVEQHRAQGLGGMAGAVAGRSRATAAPRRARRRTA